MKTMQVGWPSRAALLERVDAGARQQLPAVATSTAAATGTSPGPSAIDGLTLQPVALDRASDCRRAWQRSLLARVPDSQLAAAVDVMFAYHGDVNFFGERTSGMRRVSGYGPQRNLDIQFAPHRNKVPLVEISDQAKKECALCRPPFPDERGLSWRDYVVWPNAFPYLPQSGQHVVITADKHIGQRFTPQILGDMIDYQRHAGQQAPVTLHYNGIAGNSQFHLHWQASREKLPLQRLLDAGELPLERLHSAANGRIESYEHGYYNGILVTGDRCYVTRWAQLLVERLDSDPLTRGAYNLLLLHPADGQARLVVIPRRADELKPEVASFGKVGFGAFNLGGTVVVPRDEVPDNFGDDYLAAAARTVVRPSELSWLRELMQQPTHPMLRARASA
ncbi:MAG: hypothetical protein JXR83_03875 [Deltaproteobacteria bacterium]|nr:hypothetical protein [Deltaproteobacteria bacterium]